MNTRTILSFCAILLSLTACGSPASTTPKIHVENAWALPAAASPTEGMTATPDMSSMPGMASSETPTPPMPDMGGMANGEMGSAVYFVIVNDGGSMDTLVGVTTDVAMEAGLHQTRIENDIAQMIPISSVDIPAHGKIEFKPGGYHVMLNGLTRDLKVGDAFKLNLQFEKSGMVSTDVLIHQEQ